MNDIGWTLLGAAIGAGLGLGAGYVLLVRYLTKERS